MNVRQVENSERTDSVVCDFEEGKAKNRVQFVNSVIKEEDWASLGVGDIIVDSTADESCWPVYDGGESKDPIGLKFQVTDVRKPLLAVSRLVEKGNKVVLAGDDEESFIMNKATKVKNPGQEEGRRVRDRGPLRQAGQDM